jgi:hypothetical protein
LETFEEWNHMIDDIKQQQFIAIDLEGHNDESYLGINNLGVLEHC